jgi:hypothetical protein
MMILQTKAESGSKRFPRRSLGREPFSEAQQVRTSFHRCSSTALFRSDTAAIRRTP